MRIFSKSISRTFRTTTALALLTLSSFPAFGMFSEEEVDIDIAIVGGGMSGLTAAYDLKKSGIKATLYEGRDRLGGRTHTHYFNEDKTQFFEEGGTFIDDDHHAAINLAKEMDVNLIKRGYGTRKITGIHQQQFQDTSALLEGLKEVSKELSQQIDTINWDEILEYDSNTQEWHAKPLDPYLSGLSIFGKNFIQTYYEDETGMSIHTASVYRLKWLLEKMEEYKELLSHKNNFWSPNILIDQFAYDYTVEGGISTLVNSVVNKLNPEDIHLDHKLTHIQKDDKYTLTFQSGKQIRANYVIMTLPFSTLRRVTIDDSVGLREDQKQAIQTLSYGTNSKIGIPVESRTNLYDDLVYYFNLDTNRCGWPGHNAFTLMVNAEDGEKLNEESAQHIYHNELPLIQQAHPITSFGTPIIKNWSQDPFALGSYSGSAMNDNLLLLTPSQITGLEDIMKFAEPLNGHFFFAGEHTRADDSVVHIEGAIRSGYKAAELLKASYTK